MTLKKKAKTRNFSLVGIQYRTTPSVRRMMVDHLPFRVKLVREPDNHQDENAISVWVDDKEVPYNGMKLGYLRRQVAAVWSNEMDAGRLKIEKAYLHQLDPVEAVGEMLITLTANAKALEIGP